MLLVCLSLLVCSRSAFSFNIKDQGNQDTMLDKSVPIKKWKTGAIAFARKVNDEGIVAAVCAELDVPIEPEPDIDEASKDAYSQVGLTLTYSGEKYCVITKNGAKKARGSQKGLFVRGTELRMTRIPAVRHMKDGRLQILLRGQERNIVQSVWTLWWRQPPPLSSAPLTCKQQPKQQTSRGSKQCRDTTAQPSRTQQFHMSNRRASHPSTMTTTPNPKFAPSRRGRTTAPSTRDCINKQCSSVRKPLLHAVQWLCRAPFVAAANASQRISVESAWPSPQLPRLGSLLGDATSHGRRNVCRTAHGVPIERMSVAR